MALACGISDENAELLFRSLRPGDGPLSVDARFRQGETLSGFADPNLSDEGIFRDTAYYLSEVKEALGKTKEATTLSEAAESGSGEFFSQLHLTSKSNIESP